VPANRTSLVLALLLFVGCRTPNFPPADLSAPGWKTRTGQAIWKPDRSKPEIVGDLVIAADQSGNAYLQFSKAFPIVSARITPDAWQIEFPAQNKQYAAPGKAPSRISWLQLLRIWTKAEISKNWEISKQAENAITLSNAQTGEWIEAHF
jgi:hypothetical protein